MNPTPKERPAFIAKCLKTAEKYLRTDIVYFAKGGFWITFAGVIGSFLSLLLSTLFANFVSQEVFGIYKYILAVAGVAVAFSMSGMNPAVTQAVARGLEGILKASIKPQMKWGLAQAAFLLCVGIYYAVNENYTYLICFIIAAALAPAQSIANTYSSYLQGKKLFKESSVFTTIGISWQTLIIGLTALFFPSVPLLILAYYASSTSANLFFYFYTLKKYPPNTQVSKDDLSYGKHVTVNNILSTVATNIDNIAVYHFLGPAQLAHYSFAIMIPEKIRSMSGFMGTIAMPKIAEMNLQSTQKSIRQKMFYVFFGSFLGVVAYVIAAPFLFDLFFPYYIDAVPYSQIFALSLFAIIGHLSNTAIVAQKLKKEVFISGNVGPIIRMVTVILLTWNFGLWGAIIARMFAHLFQSFLPLYLVFRAKR